jgi:MFS family permease
MAGRRAHHRPGVRNDLGTVAADAIAADWYVDAGAEVDQHRPAAAAVAGDGVAARLPAWLPLGLYGVLTAAGLVLQRLAGLPEDPTGPVGVAVMSAAILVWSFVGSLIAARRPSHPIGWLLAGIALVWALQECSFGYAAYGLVAHPGSLPAALPVALSHRPMEPLILLGPALLFLLFPDGRLPSARWRPVAWTGVAAAAVLMLGWIAAPDAIAAFGIRNPVQIGPALLSILNPLTVVAFLLLLVVLLAAAVSSWLRLRRARGQARQQLKWFAYATAFLPVGFGLLIFGPSDTTDRIGGALAAVGSVGMPLAVAVAIFKYHLYAIDRVINRTLVYGALTVLLGGVYAGIVLALGQLLGRQSSLVVAGATLAVAALFQPARRRIQQAVDRRFNRRRYDAAKTIQAFSTRLRDEIDLDTLAAELLAVVNQTMQPTQASLWLRPPKAPARQGAATS